MLYISPILSPESLSKISLCIEDFSLSLDLLYLIASSSFGFKSPKTLTCFFPWSLIVFICFSEAFSKGV